MLGQRIITAVGLVAVLTLVLVVLPRDLAVLALAALMLMGAWEWSRLAGFRSVAARAAYVVACAAAMAGLWQFARQPSEFEYAMTITMVGWVPLFAWIALAPGFRAN